ncbi:hypothetical protein GH810_09720 [Acetobacterium paludosum]|uniref:Uncharacterized protein n=1 Tax=Acetobacterium paludosum TaxID=52693 RepID=A0A923I3V5_9FIRM|nr:hypothetical protein [Acetobacterium paludosum]MBC3888585.1 hypothetical protein [Acetobacterium paludosum]
MDTLKDAKRVGLRNIETEELIAVYPHKPVGTDEEIEKAVRDWYYEQDCAAEEKMRAAVVEPLTTAELETL